MPALDDLLSGISPETGYPDDFVSLATSARDDDFAAANAKIAALEEELAATVDALNAQKVVNYDLMASAASTENVETGNTGESEGDESDPEDIQIEDLFTKSEEE